jgi:chromosome segregation ATPase
MNRTSSVPTTPFQSIPVMAASVAPDPKALANLEAKLQASQPPAYLAFMEQFDALKDVIPDDSMRFRAALKASRTTPDALAGAVDQMLQTMQKAADDFTKTFEGNKGNLLSQGQAAVKSTQDLIASREQQRQSITEEITSLQSKLQTDTEQIQNEEHRLDGIHAGFMAAHATVLERLNAQKSHIVSQLKG